MYNLRFHSDAPGETAVSHEIMDIKYWQEKADAGLSAGLITMGQCYLKGNGVETDYSKAYRYLSKAADKGSSTGCYLLGTMFEEGLGVDKDIQKALSLYESAARTNNTYALAHIARIYAYGKLGSKDEHKAIQIYQHIIKMRKQFDDPENELLMEAAHYIESNG